MPEATAEKVLGARAVLAGRRQDLHPMRMLPRVQQRVLRGTLGKISPIRPSGSA